MQCKECSFTKKTVTGLKMHIKLNHLQVGKMQCRHCIFTANLKVSINGHYRNKHPETIVQEGGVDKLDYLERSTEAQTFSQEYWKHDWGIPTMEERRGWLEAGRGSGKPKQEDKEWEVKGRKKPGPKKGTKRKPKAGPDHVEPDPKELRMMDQSSNSNSLDLTDTIIEAEPSKALAPHGDQSPFEGHMTFMCGQCPKRSQQLERIRQHGLAEHGAEGWRELSRDQVVGVITSDQYQDLSGGSADYKCFYCQVTGDVKKLEVHSGMAHAEQVLRVVRFQAQRVTGYLECQLCGHLSPGFEKHLQKTHFHEEHPLENDVNCSKYMSKSKTAGSDALSSSQQAFKVRL
jgi:hypothetical protein